MLISLVLTKIYEAPVPADDGSTELPSITPCMILTLKLIFSRKGSDTSYGKRASPVAADGAMVSVPIPEDGFAHGITYESICGLPAGLSGLAHLDPDLRQQALPRQPGWRPSFGQCDGALTHLLHQGVGVGDLFLFYGWFKGASLPARGSHIIWGWMQVGEMHWPEAGVLPDWLTYHPHAAPALKHHSRNAIFSAADRLTWPGVEGLPGAGVFDHYNARLRLSAGERMSQWSVPSFLIPADDHSVTISRHRKRHFCDLGDGTARLSTTSPGQEYVIDISRVPLAWPWALSKLPFSCAGA